MTRASSGQPDKSITSVGIVAFDVRPEYGGPTTVVKAIEALLDDVDTDCRIVSWHTAEASGPTVVRLIRFVIDLVALVRTSTVVDIHTMYGPHVPLAIAAARLLHRPFFIRPHGALDPWHFGQKRTKKRPYEALVRLLLPRDATFLVASTAEAESVASLGPYNTRVLPFPIERPTPGLERAPTREQGGVRITYLSRITAKKRPDVFAEAASLMPPGHSTEWTMVGPIDDEYVARTEHWTNQGVRILGPLYGPDRWRALAETDIFVLLSEDESFGLVALEAALMGAVVIVSSAVPSVDGLVEQGHGRMIEPDANKLAEEVTSLIHSGTLTTLGRATKAWAEQAIQEQNSSEAILHSYRATGC